MLKTFEEFVRDNYVSVDEGFDIDMKKYHNLSALEQQYALVTMTDAQYCWIKWCITKETRHRVIEIVKAILKYLDDKDKEVFRKLIHNSSPDIISKSINQIKNKIKVDYLKKQVDKFDKIDGDSEREIDVLNGIYSHLRSIDSKETHNGHFDITRSLVGEIGIAATTNSNSNRGWNIRQQVKDGEKDGKDKPELLKDQYVVHFITGGKSTFDKLQTVKNIIENGFKSSDKDTDLSISAGTAGEYDKKVHDNGTCYGFLLKDLLDPDMDSHGYALDLLERKSGFFLVFKTDCVRMWTSDATYEVIFPAGKYKDIDVGCVDGEKKERMWYVFDGMKTFDLKGRVDDINNRYKAKVDGKVVDEKVKARGKNFKELNSTMKWIEKSGK